MAANPDQASETAAGSAPPPPGMMWRVSVMMGLQWGSLGAWVVTLPTYIAANTGDLGDAMFGESFIGDVGMTGAFGALLSPVVFGLLVDKLFNTEIMLALLHALSAAMLAGACAVGSQALFFVMLFAYFQVYAPTGSLVSSLALRKLPDSDKHFAQVRSVGTAGWVAAGALVGLWPAVTGGDGIEDTLMPMKIAVGLHLITAVYSLTLPATPPSSDKTQQPVGLPKSNRLWRNPRVLLFLAVSVLAAAPAKFYEGFINKYLNQFEYPYPAFTQSIGQIVEFVVMLAIPFMLMRFSLRSLYLTGIVCWAVRFALLAMAGNGQQAVLVYSSILLHGPCVVLVLILGQLYIDRLAPRDARASAQGAYSLAFFGVGSLLGARISGWSQAVWLTPEGASPPPYHWPTFWVVPCIFSVVGAAMFAALFREPQRTAQSPDASPS